MNAWKFVCLNAALILVCACNAGQIGEPTGLSDHSSARAATQDPTAPADLSGSKSSPKQGLFEPAPATLRKLTVEQYQNSVHDVLGADLELPPDISLEADASQNGFFAVAASNATISPAAAEKLEQAAYALAAQALATSRRDRLVPCKPAATSDSKCAETVLKSFGRRAFRRPLSGDELSRYTTIAVSSAQALGDFYQGLEFAIAGVLQSPNFLFRVELGEPDPDNRARLRYTSQELATRLSFGLWNTTPDEELLAAAESGTLDAAGLAHQADRLLADARARAALDNFHSERLGLVELPNLSKDASLIGEISDGLRAALRDDVLRTFAELSGAGKDVLSVFDSRVAFLNADLAKLYGMPAVKSGSGLTRVELASDAARTGLLGKPAFLALTSHSAETSPTLRGKFIRERVLCESIPAPPPNVVPVLGEPDPNAPTMRDRLKAHATDPSCASCHNQMDPLGLALEHFDAVGRYRADDQGHALDTQGDLDGTSFDGEVELSQLLRDDPRTAQCLVRQAFRYALGHVESAGEEPQIESLAAEFEDSGHDLSALFRSVATSDAFRYASKEKP